MAIVDVSKIPNNNKFDPVREAILELEGLLTGGFAGVTSLNGQIDNVNIVAGDNISVSAANGVITISSTASGGGGALDGELTLTAGDGIGLSTPSVFDGSTDVNVTITNTDRPNDGQLLFVAGSGLTTLSAATWTEEPQTWSTQGRIWSVGQADVFSANTENNVSITLQHANTSDVADSLNTGGIVIQSMSFDEFGHVQQRTPVNLDERYLIWRNIFTTNDNRTATAQVYNDTLTFKGAGSIAVTKSPTTDEIRFGLAVSDIRFEDGKRVARGFLYWQSNTVPDGGDVPQNSTFSFDSYLITINNSNWSEIPPTTGYSLTTYYIVRYTSIDDGAGTTASRAVTYGLPEDSTGFEGPVTFNSLSEELGSNGFTIIDGGRVKTGRIQSIGLNTSDLDQGLSVYTNQGSFFDLGSGDLVTMDFSVISGVGNFKGSLKVGQGVGNVPSEINSDGTINLADGVIVVDASGNVTISNDADIAELDTLTTTVNGINSQVNLNSSNISTNTSNITIANGNISTNAANIATLQSELTTAEGQIAANASNISTNTTNITANANSISINSSNISALQVSLNDTNNNVSANASNIQTNTANISANASGISANASSISSLTATVNNNTASITTNANAIAESNGYTEANYALTANANGVITGIQLKAANSSSPTGQVSDITMKTNTFNIVDQNDNVKLNLNNSGDLTVVGDLFAANVEITQSKLTLKAENFYSALGVIEFQNETGAVAADMKVTSYGTNEVTLASYVSGTTKGNQLILASGRFYLGRSNGSFIEEDSGDFLRLFGDEGIKMISLPFFSTSANMYVNPSTGQIYRTTSSLKYKKDVEDYTRGIEDVKKLRPVSFKSINQDSDTVYAGFIAEEVHDAGLTEYVDYNENNEPDAIHYANLVTLLTKAVQEQQEQIDALKAEVYALKNNTAS
jgi:hypothetical protein